MDSTLRRWIVFVILFLGVVIGGVYALRGSVVPKQLPKVENYERWDPELVKYVAQMPVQEGGRLKPFSTWASFALYGIHSKRTITFESNGEKVIISPTEWMLDTMFRPEVASDLPVFSINDEQVAIDLQIDTENILDKNGEKVYKKKRDYYSFDEIRSNAFIDATEQVAIDSDKAGQEGLVLKGSISQKANLIQNFITYGAQLKAYEKAEEIAAEVFKYRKELNINDDNIDEKIRDVVNQYINISEYHCVFETLSLRRYEDLTRDDPSLKQTLEFPQTIETDSYRQAIYPAHLMPSTDPYETKWTCYKTNFKDYFSNLDSKRVKAVFGEEGKGGNLAELLRTESKQFTEAKDELSKWVKLLFIYKTGDDKALLAEFKNIRSEIERRLEPRQKHYLEEQALYEKRSADAEDRAKSASEGDRKILAAEAEDIAKKADFARRKAKRESLDFVSMEVWYYKLKYYDMAMGFFNLGVCFVLALLPFPRSKFSKWLVYATMACAVIGSLFIVAGITHRSLIMGRYPLGNLYDTILMITAASVILLVIMEMLSKKIFCVGAAVTLGVLGMVLRYRYEIGAGGDNMKPLVAVLNSNYWLAVHVMAITIGYAGGLVAAKLSLFYLFARMTGIDNGDKKLRRSLTRMAYGAACFTLFFALVGTILGGIWANDSWGRFWGWDPKENGALMIVIWFLAILHARMAGYIKEWGLHIFMLLGANVIAFSWFGVNFLSTGLHSYGFASGGDGEFWLNVYYIMNAIVAVVAIGFAWYDIEIKKIKKTERLEKMKEEDSSDLSPEEA